MLNYVFGMKNLIHLNMIRGAWYSSLSLICHFLPAWMEKSKIKSCPYWGLSPDPDHQSHALLTVLTRNLLCVSIIKVFIKSCPIDSRNNPK